MSRTDLFQEQLSIVLDPSKQLAGTRRFRDSFHPKIALRERSVSGITFHSFGSLKVS